MFLKILNKKMISFLSNYDYFCKVLREGVHYPQRHNDRYLKNGVSKSILLVIWHASFQLYREHHDGVI